MVNKKYKIAHLVCTYPPYRGGMGKVATKIIIVIYRQKNKL
ncbi:MAG: hypothetical protein ABH884_01430 [Candidatus Komeilibacteria bacterium]